MVLDPRDMSGQGPPYLLAELPKAPIHACAFLDLEDKGMQTRLDPIHPPIRY